MPPFTCRCTLTFQSVGQVIMFGLGSLLINIISNDISNAEQKNASVKMVIVSYIPLVITTVVVWCLVNHFFIEVILHSQSNADGQDTQHILVAIHDTGSLHPQVTELVDLDNTERSHPQADPQDERSSDPQDNQRVDPQSTGRIPATPHEQDVGGCRDEQDAGTPDGVVADRDFRRPRLFVDFIIRRDLRACATFPSRSSRMSLCQFSFLADMAVTTSTGQAEQVLNDLLHAKHRLVVVEARAEGAIAAEAAARRSKEVLPERVLRRSNQILRRRRSKEKIKTVTETTLDDHVGKGLCRKPYRERSSPTLNTFARFLWILIPNTAAV